MTAAMSIEHRRSRLCLLDGRSVDERRRIVGDAAAVIDQAPDTLPVTRRA